MNNSMKRPQSSLKVIKNNCFGYNCKTIIT